MLKFIYRKFNLLITHNFKIYLFLYLIYIKKNSKLYKIYKNNKYSLLINVTLRLIMNFFHLFKKHLNLY
jgi:hypothetical protein